jgi:citrate synthase
MSRNVLSAEQVARRLGVKVETVYAYVSRGLLQRTLSDDGRQSRFASEEVEALAKRGRPRRESARQGAVEVSLATTITGVRNDRLLFRGHDASDLARSVSFERVAELLWTGSLPAATTWQVPEAKAKVALAAAKALPAAAGAFERMCSAVTALAAAHPLRVDLGAAAVVAHARVLLASYPKVLGRLAPVAPVTGVYPFAASLFSALSRLKATAPRVALLNSMLVLLADHELATSTLAARVAASTRADPFAVVLAGLGAVSGPLHGRSPVLAHRMLLAAEKEGAEQAVAQTLATLGRLPGFWKHPVYRGVDPRAAAILPQLEGVMRAAPRASLAEVTHAGKASAGTEPNVDFALAAVCYALEMPPGASEAIFAVARSAGFIAHALEEYGEEPLRFRARSIYLGP